MSNNSTLQSLLKLLSNENKFQIIMLLKEGEICVCKIGEKLGIEQSLVSHHIETLKTAGLVSTRKVGLWVHCSLNIEKFSELETLYVRLLGYKSISDKKCTEHEACRCLSGKQV